MSVESKQFIVVLGATGAQGGSVIEALLKNGTFRVRGVTRKISSTKSKALVSRGVEMVKGDTGDISSLVKAFEGAWGVYGGNLPNVKKSFSYCILGQICYGSRIATWKEY
jgi:uncharacterized protein YbjT (DUF2867 family)